MAWSGPLGEARRDAPDPQKVPKTIKYSVLLFHIPVRKVHLGAEGADAEEGRSGVTRRTVWPDKAPVWCEHRRFATPDQRF